MSPVLKASNVFKFSPIWNVIINPLTSKCMCFFPTKRQYKDSLMHCEDVNRHMKLDLAFFLGKQKPKKLFKKIKQVAFKQDLPRMFDKFYSLITAL